MTQNTKQEYQSPQIKQMRIGVEEGYALSRQNTVETGETTLHFGTVQGQW